ncbi:hypothetical protein EVAR_57585_1 [Eumeta japonica]|uniref:Uncharacterized protein n=1 Tax=Eumeta variegata TaxID=151549 RepID=A0A4C1Z869_EUMVA|nr:hypothetical protein EVAR_57585_1 [Eumeta japonica]
MVKTLAAHDPHQTSARARGTRGRVPWPTRQEHGPTPSMRYYALTEYGRELAASAVEFRLVLESFCGRLLPPSDILFLLKRLATHRRLLWGCECPWAAMNTYFLVAHKILYPSIVL